MFALLHDKFILLQNTEHEEDGDEEEEEEEDNNKDSMEQDEEEEESNDIEDFEQPEPATILANKRAHPAFGRVLRSKGFFWLATRPWQFGEWSQAGGILTVGCGGPWFAEVPRDMWPEDRDIVASIERDFREPWGDRRQEIVFIGEGIDMDKVTTYLDECLLSEEEMRDWESVMNNAKLSHEEKTEKLEKMWEDGWESWPPFEIVEEDDMDVDSERPKHRISEHLGHAHHGHDHVHQFKSLKQTVVA